MKLLIHKIVLNLQNFLNWTIIWSTEMADNDLC